MIKAERLGHLYGEHRALVDVSFEIERGAIVGLVGPNGAGKSTTMKIVTGYMAPTFGKAFVADIDVVEDRLGAQRRLGYLPESAPLYRDMTVRDYLVYMAKLRGVEADAREARLGFVVDACSLESVFKRPIGQLSKGFRQRVGLAQAMVHDPDLLVLDEPTSGLDPNQILEIRKLVRRLGEQKTVVLSTHVLSEVEAMCSRAIMIVGGRVHADEKLDARAAATSALVALLNAPGDAREKLGRVGGVTGVDAVATEAGRAAWRVHTDGRGGVLEEIGRLAAESRWTLAELSPEKRDLEAIFRALDARRPEMAR
jgi:ABC-2 type transport system ATP-binding protein